MFSATITRHSTPIVPLQQAGLTTWLKSQDKSTQHWVKNSNFQAEPATSLLVPNRDGTLHCVLAGVENEPNVWSLAHLPSIVPAGHYRIESRWKASQLQNAALGFALAQYQFTRYRKGKEKSLVLELAKSADIASLRSWVESFTLVRDLINTPANDMGPAELAQVARQLAKKSGATFSEIVGDQLLAKNYPAIHAVGRANPNAPRLIELKYGITTHPLLVLVGKGVTFDTGGLDIKPYSAMKLMKKDMGGAALVLGLAKLIMDHALPVRLRVLIPAVENSIAGNAFRPQDVIASRKGLSIEIGSTDAEGRLILADALTEGDAARPDLMIDVATLTGAARAALGTELPALFSNQPSLAQELQSLSLQLNDPLWQLPLWKGYAKYVSGSIADVTNSPNYGFAGSITAALFLERFVSSSTPWVHIDSYAWNAESQPGRPSGGEALAMRTLFSFIRKRYA